MKEKKPGKAKTTVTIPSVFWNAGLPSSMVPEKTTTRHFPTCINKFNSVKFTELFLEYRLPVHQLIANFWCFEIIRS
jgi:hypothetical protein